MGNSSRLYFIHCLTPVHIGAGQGVGLVDLPIMRERVTEWPLIPGSSLKGAQKEYFRQSGTFDDSWLQAAFGKPGDQEGHAGALVLSDSRILTFPVASRYGTFAYVTCPLAIKRMIRDTAAAEIRMYVPNLNEIERKLTGQNKVIVGTGSVVAGQKIPSANISESKKAVYLDEFHCEAEEDSSFEQWKRWLADQLFDDNLSKSILAERLVLVSDEAFQYFVTMCCDISPRIRIHSDTKTTVDRALWYEEYLPTESILYGMVWCDKIYASNHQLTEQKLLETLDKEIILQIGGNVSIGKGRVRCRFTQGGEL